MPSLEKDPFAFFGSGEEINDTPPPPVVIPENAPDQNSPQASLLPASTMGLNLKTYFAQDIEDPVLRLKRLENALVAVHEDMKRMPGARQIPVYQGSVAGPVAPAPVQAAPLAAPMGELQSAPEGSFAAQSLQKQIEQEEREVIASGGPESLAPQDTAPPPAQYDPSGNNVAAPAAQAPLQTYPSAYASKDQPAPPPRAATSNYTPPRVTNGATAVTDLRVGEHANKVRLVLDVSKKTLYTADLDNAENLLVIELPDAGWNAPAQKTFGGKTAVIESYRVDPYNDGTGNILVVQLKQGSRILEQSQIPALSGDGQRIFIDLAK